VDVATATPRPSQGRTTIARHRSAMRRGALSRPLAAAVAHGVVRPERSLFDFGCGRGDDVSRLRALGYRADGWDPAYFPGQPRTPADVVNLGFVVNVIEDRHERAAALRDAWELARSVLVVAARMVWEAKALRGMSHGDGVVTGRGTFQKLFSQEELRSWIEQTLGTRPVAAAPGVFYVFRSVEDAQDFLASRVRRQVAVPSIPASEELYHAYRYELAPLVSFLAERGRLPRPEELPNADEVASRFGTIRAAYAVICRATSRDQWDRIASERRNDTLVYLALAAFGGRAPFSALRAELQLDVRDFFGSYKTACAQANRLLFAAGNADAVDVACRASLVGKLTPDALYIHESATGELPALLRVYEGCGRTLAGTVEGANVVKLTRRKPKVSYLSYPRFDKDPHPELARSTVASLDALSLAVHDYGESENPWILHRKETLVSSEYPFRERFARLTVQEERYGLYDGPEPIGTRHGWAEALERANVEQRGHRIVRRPGPGAAR
jgi:DNA phosphorothioation-associated putative methyltransferase